MRKLSLALLAILAPLSLGSCARAAEDGNRSGAEGRRTVLDAMWRPDLHGRRVYEITRDGEPIGTQTVSFEENGAELTVSTKTHIEVELLGIVVYRMDQSLTNTYRDHQLVALSASTTNGQGLRKSKLVRNGDRWTGTNGDESRDFVCDCESTAMWNMSRLHGPRIIDTATSEPKSVTVEDRGVEQLNLPQGNIEARHFSVTGEIERELWYDKAGNLVASEQAGSDGSLIRQTLVR